MTQEELAELFEKIRKNRMFRKIISKIYEENKKVFEGLAKL